MPTPQYPEGGKSHGCHLLLRGARVGVCVPGWGCVCQDVVRLVFVAKWQGQLLLVAGEEQQQVDG